jgi:nitrite reductase (NO-forming)
MEATIMAQDNSKKSFADFFNKIAGRPKKVLAAVATSVVLGVGGWMAWHADVEKESPVATVTAAQVTDAPSIVLSPTDVPAALAQRPPQKVEVTLETVEVTGKLDDGSSYKYWTFGGKVPGPFVRVREGDTVHVTLKNADSSMFPHNVDFHAVTGPGGGAGATMSMPGQANDFTFKALHPGIYVYHCATPPVAHHISKGMYGLILVEPKEGLKPVDREFYVMQGEIYTAEKHGTAGHLQDDFTKLMDEMPEYYVFNGASGALVKDAPLKAKVGETVRIYFGVGGPNKISSFHVIGETFDEVNNLGALGDKSHKDVQTVIVPPGGAAIVEMKLEVPGKYMLVDHALSRAARGLLGIMEVEGPENPEVFKAGNPVRKPPSMKH